MSIYSDSEVAILISGLKLHLTTVLRKRKSVGEFRGFSLERCSTPEYKVFAHMPMSIQPTIEVLSE